MSVSTTAYYFIPFFLGLLFLFVRRRRNVLASLPFPPGPKPLPLIGNLLDMPTEYAWLTYDRWFKEFDSDIVYVNVAGTPTVILNTYEAAIELLEKRSMLYSNRVPMPMANELMGWDFYFPFMPYGDRWRSYRRLFHQAFNSNAVKHFEPQETKSARKLLLRFIERPGDVMQHLRHMAGDVILSIAYGIDVLPEHDPWVGLAEQTVHTVAEALVPATFWVDFLPWLKYVPSWFPGAGFQRKAKAWYQLTRAMVERPFEATKQNIREGRFYPSFSSYSLEKLQHRGSRSEGDEIIIQDLAGTMFVAGSDTTVSTLSTLILALLRYPEVQTKAQAELDRVLKGSLPTFADQDSLPYVTAMVREAFRWNMVTPFAVPHSSTSEDVYKGYRIPKGTMIIPNVWSILYDEEMYPDPYTFNPDRFLKDGKLNPEVRDPRTACFGFGRRICPGRYMAYASAWITAASILATMNIAKATDPDGTVIEPSWQYVSSLLHIPKPFRCSIKPRSAQAEALVRNTILGED